MILGPPVVSSVLHLLFSLPIALFSYCFLISRTAGAFYYLLPIRHYFPEWTIYSLHCAVYSPFLLYLCLISTSLILRLPHPTLATHPLVLCLS
ncbi:hypothetical protein DFP72DRAFT_877701 [Ephemerocybe angulata]|uniref:Uncharacterized protein n=1 Tax=Ephemerocybe angulata TaxID=980116 RepID=A0A8H6IAM3_9AGAR|nr:hypothetical protein DFP72DRAFT_877701 [Tulosesus angulatus]